MNFFPVHILSSSSHRFPLLLEKVSLSHRFQRYFLNSLDKYQVVFLTKSKLNINKPEIEGTFQDRLHERHAYSSWVHEKRDFNDLNSKFSILFQFSMNGKMRWSTFSLYQILEGINFWIDCFHTFPLGFLSFYYFLLDHCWRLSERDWSDEQLLTFHQPLASFILLIVETVMRECMKVGGFDCNHYSWTMSES